MGKPIAGKCSVTDQAQSERSAWMEHRSSMRGVASSSSLSSAAFCASFCRERARAGHLLTTPLRARADAGETNCRISCRASEMAFDRPKLAMGDDQQPPAAPSLCCQTTIAGIDISSSSSKYGRNAKSLYVDDTSADSARLYGRSVRLTLPSARDALCRTVLNLASCVAE